MKQAGRGEEPTAAEQQRSPDSAKPSEAAQPQSLQLPADALPVSPVQHDTVQVTASVVATDEAVATNMGSAPGGDEGAVPEAEALAQPPETAAQPAEADAHMSDALQFLPQPVALPLLHDQVISLQPVLSSAATAIDESAVQPQPAESAPPQHNKSAPVPAHRRSCRPRTRSCWGLRRLMPSWQS